MQSIKYDSTLSLEGKAPKGGDKKKGLIESGKHKNYCLSISVAKFRRTNEMKWVVRLGKSGQSHLPPYIKLVYKRGDFTSAHMMYQIINLSLPKQNRLNLTLFSILCAKHHISFNLLLCLLANMKHYANKITINYLQKHSQCWRYWMSKQLWQECYSLWCWRWHTLPPQTPGTT